MIEYNKVVLPEDESKWSNLGKIIDYKAKKYNIEVALQNGKLKITSLDNGILNIQVSKDLGKIPQTNAVILKNKTPPPLVVENNDELMSINQELETIKFASIEIDQKDSKLTFKDGFGFGIFTETIPNFHEEGWYKTVKHPEVLCENHYGFGEKGGPLDKKGETISFWNTDSFAYDVHDGKLYQTQPIQIVVRPNGFCYALIYDNPFRSQMKIGEENDCSSEYYVQGGGINYYLIIGPTVYKVFTKIQKLLGKPSLPPISALGHHQSKWSYYSETEVRELAKEFRERKIPCDFIHLDIDYMDEYRIFTWDKKNFPNPKKLANDLFEEGFRLMAMTDPGVKVDPEFKIYKEGIRGKHFCLNPDGTVFTGPVWPGDCHFPDFTQTKTREWFGSQYKALTDVGIRGFWIDMNEPSIFSDKGTMDDEVIHPGDESFKLHKEVHNQYAHLMAQATYEGLQKLLPNTRTYINSRAAYLGTHRYAGTWTGDNNAEWEHLQISIPMILNMAASGQLMIGPDIGGFAGKPSSELLTRWYQAGILYPYFRNHTINQKCSQEPWIFGKKTEEIIRKTIQLRYSLIIYIYNVVHKTFLTGVPAFRALWIDYPKDPVAHMAEWSETEYMFGDNLLVAPVLQKGKRKREVYLPAGKWYSFNRNKRFDGGKIHEIDVPLDLVPIFVREGSIIPFIDECIQHTGEIKNQKISLHVYPRETEAQADIYLDDGETFNFEKGDYEIAHIEAEKRGHDTWYINVKREGKTKQYIDIGEIIIFGEEKSNYLLFEK